MLTEFSAIAGKPDYISIIDERTSFADSIIPLLKNLPAIMCSLAGRIYPMPFDSNKDRPTRWETGL
ncbi:hypothetical protein BX666DRAFT_1932144 [Dichotomocladium elegans]|nr:hypothetical protein BX666DRAFT_1932144 [Dichotomocladium elegans]